MNSKFFVSYEAARLLKEKGYDDEYITFYNENGELIIPYGKEEYHVLYPCPTKAEAIDWLESKEMFIGIGGVGSGKLQKWSYSVFDYNTCDNYESEYIYPTRLEAEDAAIIKALELL